MCVCGGGGGGGGSNGHIFYASTPVEFLQIKKDMYWYILISLHVWTSLGRSNMFTSCLYEQGSLVFSRSCIHGTFWKRDLVSTALLIKRMQIFGVISAENIPSYN